MITTIGIRYEESSTQEQGGVTIRAHRPIGMRLEFEGNCLGRPWCRCLTKLKQPTPEELVTALDTARILALAGRDRNKKAIAQRLAGLHSYAASKLAQAAVGHTDPRMARKARRCTLVGLVITLDIETVPLETSNSEMTGAVNPPG